MNLRHALYGAVGVVAGAAVALSSASTVTWLSQAPAPAPPPVHATREPAPEVTLPPAAAAGELVIPSRLTTQVIPMAYDGGQVVSPPTAAGVYELLGAPDRWPRTLLAHTSPDLDPATAIGNVLLDRTGRPTLLDAVTLDGVELAVSDIIVVPKDDTASVLADADAAAAIVVCAQHHRGETGSTHNAVFVLMPPETS